MNRVMWFSYYSDNPYYTACTTRINQYLIRCDKTDGCKKKIITTGLFLHIVLYFITFDFASGFLILRTHFKKCVRYLLIFLSISGIINQYTTLLLLCVNFI